MQSNTIRYTSGGSKQLGQILQEGGHVDPNHIDRALEIQKAQGGMFGRILTEMGVCSSDTVSHALLHQSPIVRRHMRARNNTAPVATPSVSNITLTTRPAMTVAVMAAFDLVFFLLSLTASAGIYLLLAQSESLEQHAQLWPIVILFFVIFALQDLYWVAPQNPIDELRSTTLSLTVLYFGLAGSTFFLHHNAGYSRALFVISWLLSIIFVPRGRAIVRKKFSARKWWGHPVVVISSGEAGRKLVRNMRKQPGLGLKPMVLLDETAKGEGRIAGVPVLNDLNMAPILAKKLKIKYVVVAMPDAHNDHLVEIVEKYGSAFPNLVVIPNLLEFFGLQVPGRDK